MYSVLCFVILYRRNFVLSQSFVTGLRVTTFLLFWGAFFWYVRDLTPRSCAITPNQSDLTLRQVKSRPLKVRLLPHCIITLHDGFL